MLTKLFFAALLISVVTTSGCVTRSQAEADEHEAYLDGQRDAFASVAEANRTSIMVIGQVQNREIPWKDGMTLAQAIVAANYVSNFNPREIILLRRGKSISIDPKELLRGHDVPLEPGDTITLR
jgi:hypothetical protein